MSLAGRAILPMLLLFAASLGPFAMPAEAQQTTNVAVGDVWFCSSSFSNGVCTTQIEVGDTVVWDFGGGSLPHTTTECGQSCDNPTGSPLWDSGLFQGSGSFSQTFDTPGTFLYLCTVHPFSMRGEIVVQAAQQPTSTPGAAQPTDTPGADPTVAPTAASEALPVAGTTLGPSGAGNQWLGFLLIAFGAAVVGTSWYTWRRWQGTR